MQLGVVRLMGYLPEDWFEQVPPSVAAFIGQQLGIAPDALAAYGERAATRSEHLQLVLRHLGYRKWQPLDSPGLEAWLLERALEHDQPRLLLQAACQKLHQDRLLRPAISVLELLVSQALLQTDAATYQRLAPLLTPVALVKSLVQRLNERGGWGFHRKAKNASTSKQNESLRASSEKSNAPCRLRCCQFMGELAAMASATAWRSAAGAWNKNWFRYKQFQHTITFCTSRLQTSANCCSSLPA